ncbi:hypothetical protein BU23DRAFT_576058 [Bimuria novae-zelandiae CBS 107.79]|uniref:Lytic polysaccharide monooxygenase n=1 Tax=Bimuria novae-zelandiae CBS 107.79 TaxID=1447943 RepID=A0A6A5UGC9_9PLEO|nr:hypothetical protein BU23DRAFT_576058 [Bimuria novae-zelandiae CBS 107.79]
MYNTSLFTLVLALAFFVHFGASHMHLEWPPTLKAANNPHTQGEADPYLNYNYGCCGREVPGPCKGHLDLLGTDEGKPVVTWAPGQKVNFTLSGSSTTEVQGGTHYGGSCQAGFSTDGGKTFKVAATWNGNCPHRGGTTDPSTQVFDFTVPADLPAGERNVFAWTWLNREKEFNMNCAVVSIANSEDLQTPDEQPSPSSAAPPPSPTSSSVPKQPSPTPSTPPPQADEDPSSETPQQPPTQAQPPSTQPQPTGSAQYTLEGCTCSCPYQTWSPACSCYECKSPATKRHIVERKALELHKRDLYNAAKLNVPARRSEAVAWNSRPEMLLDIDFAGAACHSLGNPYEVEFPDPGPDVVEGDGEYQLKPPVS